MIDPQVQKIYRHVLGNRKKTYRRVMSRKDGEFLIVIQLDSKGEKVLPLSLFYMGE